MHKLARLAALTLLITLAIPASARRVSPGTEVAYKVRLYVEARDCVAAVARLNEGLAKNYPEVNLLAGAMFENGVCVKADWDRAVSFYANASKGGQKAAIYRLISGFAAPEHGPDMAAALWWANRPNNEFGVKYCEVSEANRGDPDRFVEELRTWPQPQLTLCNYMVGVLATMSDKIRYPENARRSNLEGTVTMLFYPAVPRIDIEAAEPGKQLPSGWMNGNALPDRKSRNAMDTFVAAMRQVADRALERYPQPAGIPPGKGVSMGFVFQLED